MGVYLILTFILLGLFNLSKCESVLGNIDSITIEIDLDSDNNGETTKKEFIDKAQNSEIEETTVYFNNEANLYDQKNTLTTASEDSKILSRRDDDSEREFDKSTIREGFEQQNNLVTLVEDFFKREEQKVSVDDDSVRRLRTKALKRPSKKQKLSAHKIKNEPTPTSESLYETKWTSERSLYTNEHENKATGEYAPLDEKVHNLLHRHKTTTDVTPDEVKFNENEIKTTGSLNIEKIKMVTPLSRITDYDKIPTKTPAVPRRFSDLTDFSRNPTDLYKDLTDIPKESTTSTYSENINTIISHNDPIDKELTAATAKNVNDENILNGDNENKEVVREWIPLNIDKIVQEKKYFTPPNDKDEVKEIKTVVPITWKPEYGTRQVINYSSDLSIPVKTQVTNNNYTIGLNTSADLETTTETVQNLTTYVSEGRITKINRSHKSIHKIKCKYAKKVNDFDINKLTGVLQTVYYTMPEKIPCFKMFVSKLSNEEKHQYYELYGDFQGRINWTKCDLEIKAETKIQRKHFLQSSELSDGIFENKIIVDENTDADADEKPTLVEDSPDQWSVVNNLVLLRDCKTGLVLFFKRNTRGRVSHRELKEALFAAGEGFNGRLSCRHKGHGTDL